MPVDVLCAGRDRQGSVPIVLLINIWDAFCTKGAEARSAGHRGYKDFRLVAGYQKKKVSTQHLVLHCFCLNCFCFVKPVLVSGVLKFRREAQLGKIRNESGAAHKVGQ